MLLPHVQDIPEKAENHLLWRRLWKKRNLREEQAGTGEGSGTDSSPAKDTLIIATANETPSVTTNEHSAVAGTYLNQMTHNGLFKMDENL